MDNTIKLNKTLFLLGRFIKRIEIKDNRITDISFYNAVEDDCAYIKRIVSDDVIPLLNNRGLFIDYGKRIISIYDDKGNNLVGRQFDLSVANEIGHTKLGEIISSY
jgi:hypothetical protein